MITRVGAFLLISGEHFSPARAEAEFGIDMGLRKHEPGDIGTRGSFAGKPYPYGSVIWEVSCEGEGLIPVSFTPFHVANLKGRLMALGAETIVLYVNIAYREQCKFELGAELLMALANLGIDVGFTCYLDE